MIIDRYWNKFEQKYNISYIDKAGNRQFYSKYLHHWKTYEYDNDNGTDTTWNGRKCCKVFKDSKEYRPNEFDQLEFIYELPDDITKNFYAINTPRVYTWDIETEVSDEFPAPEIAAQRVTSISLVGPDLSCIVFGLHDLKEDQVERFKERYTEWIHNNHFASNILGDRTPKVLYKGFSTEQELLKYWFGQMLPKIPCLAGWNSYNFDWRYITNRAKRLFGEGEMLKMLRRVSPTGELRNIRFEVNQSTHENITSPRHMINADYMLLCKQYDYTLKPYESYSLDWVAEHAVGANKIKYDGTLQQLYERDYEWYYYYNAIDSLLVQLIHKKLKCIEVPCSVSSVTLVPYQEALGQIALTTANIFSTFYQDGKHVVWDYDAIPRFKEEYEGAFCDAVPGLYEFTVCDDFASLYPSQVQTCNFSFENIIENKEEPDALGRRFTIPWTESELDEFRKDPTKFVSVRGTVYDNDKDYCFKVMQRNTKKGRDALKYLGQKIESELLTEIDRLIAEKEAAA